MICNPVIAAEQVGALRQYGLLEGVNLLEWALEQTVGGTALTTGDATGVPLPGWWWVTLARFGGDACLTIQDAKRMFYRNTYQGRWSEESPWMEIAVTPAVQLNQVEFGGTTEVT